MGLVFRGSRSEQSDRLTLLAIADNADDFGVAYPGVATIAAKARIGYRTAQGCIQSLEKMGELSVELNGGPKGCNRYQINVPLLEEQAKSPEAREAKKARGAKAAPRQSLRTPAKFAPRQNTAQTPAKFADEPSENRHTNPLTPLPADPPPSADASESKVSKKKDAKEKKPRPSRKRPDAHPEFQAACDDWCTIFEQKTGNKYPFTARDGKAMKKLLEYFGDWAKAKAFIAKCRRREAEGYPFKATRTLYNIGDKLSELVAAVALPPSSGNGRHQDPIPVIHQKPNDEDPRHWTDFLKEHGRAYCAFKFAHPSVREGVFLEWKTAKGL